MKYNDLVLVIETKSREDLEAFAIGVIIAMYGTGPLEDPTFDPEREFDAHTLPDIASEIEKLAGIKADRS